MDEVGVLKDSFNKMIRRLNDLVISEYQARDQLQKAEISEQKMAMLYLKQQINSFISLQHAGYDPVEGGDQ